MAGPGGPSVGGWRDCGAVGPACGCSSRTHCKGAGSCSLCGPARLSCWRQSLAGWWVEAAGGVGGHLQVARCPKLPTRCSD